MLVHFGIRKKYYHNLIFKSLLKILMNYFNEFVNLIIYRSNIISYFRVIELKWNFVKEISLFIKLVIN